MANKLQDAKRILSYWGATSFLAQENFPVHNKNSKIGDKTVNEIVFMCDKIQNTNKDILLLDSVFLQINKTLVEYKENLLKKQKNKKTGNTNNSKHNSCKHETINPMTGRITFEFGKVRRQCCINAINDIYQFEDNDIEEDNQKIAYFGFQLTGDGKYVEGSLSISPILWSIYALKHKKEINQNNYHEEIKNLEKDYFDSDVIYKNNNNIQLSEMTDYGFSQEAM